MHRLLIPFPLGLLATSFFFDVAWMIFGRAELARVAWWLIPGGVLTGLAAAVVGLLDYRAIGDGSRAKKIGALHGIGNLFVIVLFAASWIIRDAAHPGLIAVALSGMAVAAMIATGWLGGQLANRLAPESEKKAPVGYTGA